MQASRARSSRVWSSPGASCRRSRTVLQRSQGVGQQLRAHAFTHHIA
ncbi:Uncharacterised protein [Bordetella pertussis]|nr:Uncharacterised protein [Bordetella pertussis]